MKVAGDTVTLPQLADTLEAISTGGSDAFYMDGGIAQSIVDTVNASGGIMTLEDLRTYAVRMEEPVHAQYNGRFQLNVSLCYTTQLPLFPQKIW
jgi:gamma-glutamyltranspeptidase